MDVRSDTAAALHHWVATTQATARQPSPVERGRIALSDTISDHVPDVPCGDTTVAQLLSHTSGLQAETDGSWWERSPGYTWMELVAQGMVARHPAGQPGGPGLALTRAWH